MSWSKLTIPQRSQLMSMFIKNGVTSLPEMRRLYDLQSSQPSQPSFPTLAETLPHAPAAPVYANGGPKEDGYVRRITEDSPEFVGPPTPDVLFNGPNPPYGFFDAPIDWDDIEARQHYAESRFKNKQRSGPGARGPYQIMPRTWDAYTKKLGMTGDIDDYNDNKVVRDAVMKTNYNSGYATRGFPSDSVRTAKALAAYNWGQGNLTNHLQSLKDNGVDIYHSMDWIDTLPNEPRNYVNFILRKKNGPADLTNEAFEKALPHRFDAFPEAEYSKGGKIHIKKENRGKFTALKKRTGHSASWFKAHGTPAQKKMAVFALNARKWKHDHGGFIF